jgi:hypothetical protein
MLFLLTTGYCLLTTNERFDDDPDSYLYARRD